MNKTEFVDIVAAKADLSKKDAKLAVEAFLDGLTEELTKGETVSFVGFGAFSVTTRAARTTKVPNSDKIVEIPETKVAKFKVGKNLKDALNK
jgi:DNA-binding protein HU-beta